MKLQAGPNELREIMASANLTERQTAELLYVTHEAVRSWLRFANPTPFWATELLRYTIADKSEERLRRVRIAKARLQRRENARD